MGDLQKVTLSFNASTEQYRGDIGHNLRTRKGSGVEQNGVKERKDWNIYYVNPIAGKIGDNPDTLVKNILKSYVADDLNLYNQKILRSKNPSRVLTLNHWYHNIRVMHDGSGKLKRGYEEFYIQVGDKFTGCPYVYKTNNDGKPVDKNGKVISSIDTDKQLIPVLGKDGKPIKSVAYHNLSKLYLDIVKYLQEVYPELIIVSFGVHADEFGGIHIHINYIPLVKTPKNKRGIGWTIAKSQWMTSVCDRLNIPYNNEVKKKKNKDDIGNAVDELTQYTRELLTDFMLTHGYQRVDGGCKGEKHETIPEFKRNNTLRAQELRKKDIKLNKKEIALNKKEAELKKFQQNLFKQNEIISTKQKALNDTIALHEQLNAEKDKYSNLNATLNQHIEEYANKKNQLDYEIKNNQRWQDDLIARNDNVSRLEASAEKKMSEANALLYNIEKKSKELSLLEVDLKNKDYLLGNKITQIEQREKDINADTWIIRIMKTRHPDLLQKLKNEYDVEHPRVLYGQLTRNK